ncbi:hypothetical protein AG4045_008104 [Apium graveolens]|uniref:NB-ARC domain-containing protein n=1 Tax=Apium graveolens TaxID=4045 RepID=A0A6L5B8G7_APIGR|nr:hypothetical protein AG4045_008104 [Apium graveolens]
MIKQISYTTNSYQIRSSESASQMELSTNSSQEARSQNGAGIQTHVVGFEDDARRLVEQLMGGKKQLQFISVFGMAGLGKTTLVKKIFNEPSVVYYFYVRAWTTVTQEPNKRDLLAF